MPKNRNSKARTRPARNKPSARKINLSKRTLGAARSATLKGTHELQSPSAQARSRWHAIPLLSAGSGPSRQIAGRVGFDSWAGAVVGLRDVDSGHVRHLQVEAGATKVELVAERKAVGWEFVARVYIKDDVAHQFVLEAGRRRVLPQADGFYLWNSKSIVRKLRLISLDRQIVFGGITW